MHSSTMHTIPSFFYEFFIIQTKNHYHEFFLQPFFFQSNFILHALNCHGAFFPSTIIAGLPVVPRARSSYGLRNLKIVALRGTRLQSKSILDIRSCLQSPGKSTNSIRQKKPKTQSYPDIHSISSWFYR